MNKNNKLLLIIDCYKNPFAGTEGQLMMLIHGLKSHGYQLTLMILRGWEYSSSNRFPVPVDILDIGRIVSPVSWFRLAAYFLKKRSEGFNIAQTFFCDSSIICPPILKMLGYSVIISRRDMGYWYTHTNIRLLRINSMYVDYVIANSEAVKSITMRKENYPGHRVRVIYNGYEKMAQINIPDHSPVESDNIALKLVIVANIRPIKRIQDAIDAVAIAADSVQNISLYIVGGGDAMHLQKHAKQKGVADRVHFLGPRSDVQKILPDFDIGILCSESEGFSNTVIEYLQAGLPVICSNVGGNPEIIDHGVSGYLYDMGDVLRRV